jgi:phosphopentomutase
VKRALILVMDSFGIGGAPDAAAFGDAGADTLGHIAESCARGEADRDGVRAGALRVPHLVRLGLGRASALSSGRVPPGLASSEPAGGVWGSAIERSRGKDTPSGHWEMAGLPVESDWGYFPNAEPCFPGALTEALIVRCELPGVLGNRHASGTEILDCLGEEHIRTGSPILYTSADSVLQIAAHERHFGLERLYEVCRAARELADAYDVGRVIARPFVGERRGEFRRTAGRRDLATPPHGPTLLDVAEASGHQVVSVGKIGDIFAHRGTGREIKADGNKALFDATLAALKAAPDGGLIFTNFVDFDMLYGHRRDLAGYAAALEAFDRRLPELWDTMAAADLALITADHGCDPVWSGTDHTREQVPVLAFGPRLPGAGCGVRDGLADVGQTVARHLDLPPLAHGRAIREALPIAPAGG